MTKICHQQIATQHCYWGRGRGFVVAKDIYQFLILGFVVCLGSRYVNFHILFPQSHKKFFFLKGKRCRSTNHYFFVCFFVPWTQGAWNIKWCEPSYRLDVDRYCWFFHCLNILSAKLLALWLSPIARNGDKMYIFVGFGVVLARLLECLSTSIGT